MRSMASRARDHEIVITALERLTAEVRRAQPQAPGCWCPSPVINQHTSADREILRFSTFPARLKTCLSRFRCRCPSVKTGNGG